MFWECFRKYAVTPKTTTNNFDMSDDGSYILNSDELLMSLSLPIINPIPKLISRSLYQFLNVNNTKFSFLIYIKSLLYH